MKIKKLAVAIICFVIVLIAYIAASVLCCYTTKPEVSEGEFSFSITYAYKGEIKTLSGVFACQYSGSNTIQGEHQRYWDGEVKYENSMDSEKPFIVDENEEMQTVLSLQPYMSAGYLMGDPLYEDHYQEYGAKGAAPHIEYYDHKNDISLNDENKDEILTAIGFKIIDFTYADPIENSFSFSGIQYEADNVIIFAAISLVFLILCLVFVRKDEVYQYSSLDRLGVMLNYAVGAVAVPFITVVCTLFGITESNVHLINQITYNIPPITILCLAFSVVFRRKGFSKLGFVIQFFGIALFLLIVVAEALF